jgi:hypothetical protein
MSWPTAELDPVRRLRVLAGAVGSVALVEHEIDAPFERVWSFIADLERSVPAFDFSVRSVELRPGPHGLRALATTAGLGRRTLFDVELTDGFCWMQSPWYVVGMAAAPDPDGAGTRYAHLEGVPRRGFGLLRPVFRAMVASDVRGITRLVTRGGSGGTGAVGS